MPVLMDNVVFIMFVVFIHRKLGDDGRPVGPFKFNRLPCDDIEYNGDEDYIASAGVNDQDDDDDEDDDGDDEDDEEEEDEDEDDPYNYDYRNYEDDSDDEFNSAMVDKYLQQGNEARVSVEEKAPAKLQPKLTLQTNTSENANNSPNPAGTVPRRHPLP